MVDFGPNRARVEQLLEQVEEVSTEDLRFLATAPDSEDDAVRRARAAARTAAEQSGRQAAAEEIARAISDWAQRLRRHAYEVGHLQEADEMQVRSAAAAVLVDAALAVLVADAIPRADFELLYEPWRTVTQPTWRTAERGARQPPRRQ